MGETATILTAMLSMSDTRIARSNLLKAMGVGAAAAAAPSFLRAKAPGQLYDLEKDPGETANLHFKEQAKRKELQTILEELKSSGRSAPKNRIPIGIENIRVVK